MIYPNLRHFIDTYITANGNKEITGTILNDLLNSMITALGANYQLAGVATPSTNPGEAEQAVMWFASQAGTYTNFGAIVLPLGIHLLKWDGTSWTSQTFFAVDNAPTEGSNNLISSGAVYQAVNSLLADGYLYAGIASANASSILSPANGTFYVGSAGTYTGYAGSAIEVALGQVIIVKRSSSAWSYELITVFQVDDAPTSGSAKLVKSGGIFTAIQNSPQLGYYRCNTAAATAAKTVASDNYILPTIGGGSIKIKMTNANTAASGVTLQIGSAAAKPLYYAGAAVTALNTWQDGETVEVYYDGTNYQANNVAGGSDDLFDFISTEEIEVQPIEIVEGKGVGGSSTFIVDARRSMKIYPINGNQLMKFVSNDTKGAICIKNNDDYTIIAQNDLGTNDVNQYFFTQSTYGDLESQILDQLVYRPDKTKQLYLAVNNGFNGIYYDCHFFGKNVTDGEESVIIGKNGAVIDNYDYIKGRACEEKNSNIYVGSTAYNGKGIIYNKNGAIEANNFYNCAVIGIDFGKQYTYINYSLFNGANNFALLVNFGTGYRQMTVSDFVQDSEWMGNDVFFDHSHSYIFKQSVANNGSFWCPKKTDFINEPDGVALVINTHYQTTDVSSSFIINEGDETHTPTIEATIFGYPINGGGAIPEETDMIAGKTVIFFGDSITHGNTYGSYVDTVRIKANLGQAINKGVSGYRSYNLVDQITGYGIRGGSVGSPVDFSNIHAATIQIGTNDSTGADYMGDIEKDIPDISIYDISSYPFNYNAPGKTIESATLNNADDFFKLCFPNTYYGNLALIIEYIRWKKPSLRLYMISIPAGMGGRYKVINPAMKALCSKMSIEVIDAIENSGAGQWNITEWSPDTTHLNTVGVELWGSYIARKLQELYY